MPAHDDLAAVERVRGGCETDGEAVGSEVVGEAVGSEVVGEIDGDNVGSAVDGEWVGDVVGGSGCRRPRPCVGQTVRTPRPPNTQN